MAVPREGHEGVRDQQEDDGQHAPLWLITLRNSRATVSYPRAQTRHLQPHLSQAIFRFDDGRGANVQGHRQADAQHPDAGRPRRAVPRHGSVRGVSAGAVDRHAADRSALTRRRTASIWRAPPTTAWRSSSRKYPDRFPGFVASLPLSDADAAMREIERAVGELGARGIQLFSNVNGKPLDRPEYLAFFDRMAAFDLPVWLHPFRGADVTDYASGVKVAVRDLVDVRLAVRDQRGDGAAGVFGTLRSTSRTEDHHAPPWRDGAVLRGPCRTRLGSTRDVGRRTRTTVPC